MHRTTPRRRVTILTAALASLAAATPAATAGENAADDYRLAFAALPTDPATLKQLEDWNDGMPDAAAAAAIGEQLRPALDAVHGGAMARSTDWGWDLSQGERLMVPELNQLRTASHAAAFEVRRLMGLKQYGLALRVASDALCLARRSGGGKLLVARLVGFGVEGEVQHAVDAGLPGLPPAHLDRWAADLAALPPTPPRAELGVSEGEVAAAMLAHGDPDGPIFKGTDLPADPAARATLGGQARRIWADLAAVPAVPPDAAGVAAFRARLAAAPRPVQAIAPRPVEGLLQVEAEHAVEQLLYAAAVSVARDGPDAVRRTADPCDGGRPFAYRAVPGGFELSSKLQARGKAVAVTAGPAALP